MFGFFAVQLSGVYFAMLTLAFAQIVWSIAFQWVAVTGGDNGILGVWPEKWAASPSQFLLAVARRSLRSPVAVLRMMRVLAVRLRAARDTGSRRCAARPIGINGKRDPVDRVRDRQARWPDSPARCSPI